MKKKIIMSVFLSIFSAFVLLPVLTAEQEMPLESKDITVSMDLKDASMKDLLKMFSIQTGMNFIASEGVQDRRVTLYLDKVPLRDAMQKMFKANNLLYDLDKNANIFIVKDMGRPGPETVTRVFPLKYASVSTSSIKSEAQKIIGAEATASNSTSSSSSSSSDSEETGKWKADDISGITEVVRKLLSANGSVVEDYRTNSLIVTDVPNNMEVIAQTISALDVFVPQVMLEVEMLDVNKNLLDKIGFKYYGSITDSLFKAVLTGAKTTTGIPFGKDIISSKQFAKVFTPGTIDFSQQAQNVIVDFLKQQTDTKILARPRILTLNNETAEIFVNTQEAIGTIQQVTGGGSGIEASTTSAERTDTGVSLRVTPQISMESNEITMFVYPKVKDATTSATFNSGTTVYKDPEERSTKSLIRIKDGETVVIGGLIRHDRSEVITKVPFLGDIPLLGKFFTHRYKDKDKQRELLVFITPHIVRERGVAAKDINKAEIVPINKIPLPEREQGTYSGIDRQAIIATNLNKFENKR